MNDIENKIWKVEDIFQDIPGDPDNVNMIIPDEIAAYLELNEGDTIQIKMEDGGLVLSKVVDKYEESI